MWEVLRQRELQLVLAIRFLEAVKPSEPHLVPYLKQVKGFTNLQVLNEIFPTLVYAQCAFAALAAPGVHVLGYKPCILLGSAARLLTRLLLLYATSLPAMQLMQVAFGLVLSADIVLAAYIYQLVPPRDFVAATAVASAASLLGLVLGAESSEILLALGASLTSLFYISLATVSSSAVLTLWLPASSASVARVQSSVLGAEEPEMELTSPHNPFMAQTGTLGQTTPEIAGDPQAPAAALPPSTAIPEDDFWEQESLHSPPASAAAAAAAESLERPKNSLQEGSLSGGVRTEERASVHAGTLHVDPLLHRVTAWREYRDTLVAMWRITPLFQRTLWWLLIVGPVMYFVEDYAMNLFDAIDSDVEYNGHVTALCRLSMSAAALAAPTLARAAQAAGMGFHAAWTLGVAGLVFALAWTRALFIAYAVYALTMSVLQMQLCLVQGESAALLPSDDYSTLFGVVTTGTLLLQSAQQAVLQSLGQEPSGQYALVACWTLAVAGVLAAVAVFARRRSGAATRQGKIVGIDAMALDIDLPSGSPLHTIL